MELANKYYSDGTYTKGDGKLYMPGVGVVGKDKSTNASKAESGSSTPVTTQKTNTNSGGSSNRYNTTVTESNGSTSSGYILDGKSYYDDGREINKGASVVDSTGKTWVKGGDPDAGLTIDEYLTKYGANNVSAAYNNKYGDMGDELKYNPYEEQYNQLQEAYKKQEEMLREQNRLAVEQGTNRLNAQKSNINQAADENARQAYVQYMQSQKALPQQLAVQGASGGATETAQLGLQTNYQNSVNSINQNKANRLQEIDNAIVDLQNTGDLSTVEQVLANNQAALDAYMSNFDKGVGYNQWANQFNANRQDTAADLAYRDKVYADNMAQQQWENDWFEKKYQDSKDSEEFERTVWAVENGLADAKVASALFGVPEDKVIDYMNYIKKARQLELNNTQSLINSRNEGSDGGTTSKKYDSVYKTAEKMWNDQNASAESVNSWLAQQDITEAEHDKILTALGVKAVLDNLDKMGKLSY